MDHRQNPHPQPLALNPSERALLRLLAAGLTAEQAGAHLQLSPGATRARVARLRRRLGVTTTVQLIHRAHGLGLLAERSRPRAEPPVVMPTFEPREEALTPKPRATAADARLLATRLEATFRGGAR